MREFLGGWVGGFVNPVIQALAMGQFRVLLCCVQLVRGSRSSSLAAPCRFSRPAALFCGESDGLIEVDGRGAQNMVPPPPLPLPYTACRD